VPGAGASFSVRTESALASSCSMSWSHALSCVWLYVYFARMFCSAERNSCPKSSHAATLMLAISVSTVKQVSAMVRKVSQLGKRW
jgi:hypothetical protein